MARCRGRVQLSGPWQGEGRAEPHVPRSRGSSRVSGGAPGHESKGRLDRSAHFQDPKCRDGGCEHLRASVSQGTHQEGHQPGGVGEEVVSGPDPAQHGSGVYCSICFPRDVSGEETPRTPAPFCVSRAFPCTPGLPPEGSSGSWVQLGLLPRNLCACHTGICGHICACEHTNTHTSCDHTHDYSPHIYTCNHTHVINHTM